MNDFEIKCGICGNNTSLRFKAHPGYLESKSYDIRHCDHCDASFSVPLAVDNDIYDLIYSNLSKIPGYSRYLSYAVNVLNEINPLGYLASQEAMYWAITDFLKKYKIQKNSKILEVGCGFGYLTYSIFKEGYNITGLDMSSEAVKNAKKNYGDHYVCANVGEYSKGNAKQYDVIILTEVIEHIPDIATFIGSLGDIVKDDGYIVITTPDKSAYSSNVVWATELPPIHLWWLSNKSVQNISSLIGRHAVFTDFSEYNQISPIRPSPIVSIEPEKNPIFSKDKILLHKIESVNRLSMINKAMLIIKKACKYILIKLFKRLALKYIFNSKERGVLCAVLVKSETPHI